MLPLSFHLPYNQSSTFANVILIRYCLIYKDNLDNAKEGGHQLGISDNGYNYGSWWRPLTQTRSHKKPLSLHQLEIQLPSAHHFGGVFEAMIKSAKKVIKTILADTDVNNEELHSHLWRRTIVDLPTNLRQL